MTARLWHLVADAIIPRSAVEAVWRCPCILHADRGLLGERAVNVASQWLP